MFLFKKKPIYMYNILDKIRIDLNSLKNNKDVSLVEICQSNDYIFYNYKPSGSYSSKYILGQMKENKKQIIFFGDGYDLATIYHNHLFLCNNGGETNKQTTFIKSINLENGKENNYNLRGDYSKFVVINGFGRYYTTDRYIDMNIEQDTLVIHVEREKGSSNGKVSDKFNKDMKFEIIFKYNENSFVPFFKIDNDLFEFSENN